MESTFWRPLLHRQGTNILMIKLRQTDVMLYEFERTSNADPLRPVQRRRHKRRTEIVEERYLVNLHTIKAGIAYMQSITSPTIHLPRDSTPEYLVEHDVSLASLSSSPSDE